MKFVKEVKKEVLDTKALHEAICRETAMTRLYTGTYLPVRLVMSHNTKQELIRECSVHGQYACYGGGGGKVTFEGCEIDINESLGFGEVLFTMELMR
jgi:hypothetical protein